MLDVLGPRPAALPVPLASLMTEATGDQEVEAAAAFFLEHGVCVCPGRLSEGTLGRIRTSWRAAEAAAKIRWEAAAAVSQVPRLGIVLDECFLTAFSRVTVSIARDTTPPIVAFECRRAGGGCLGPRVRALATGRSSTLGT